MKHMCELKLLPCPFCGGEAAIDNAGGKYQAWCKHCCCIHMGEFYNTEAEAIAAWNRRTQPENEPLTLENGFDITNADGSPIDYDALAQKYKDHLCYCDIDGFYIGEDGQIVLMDDCGSAVWVDRGDYHIEVRKPERSEG